MSSTSSSSAKPTFLAGDGERYPDKMAEVEDALVRRRRELAQIDGDLPAATSALPAPRQPLAALALSGGGIRSATVSLGLLQSLAKSKLLRRFDFLSTVSGGGYIGGFLGTLYARKSETLEAQGARVTAVENILNDHSSQQLRWLRENGRYLTPNGGGDVLLAVAFALRNWISVLVVMATLALMVFLGIDLLALAIAKSMDENAHWFGAPEKPGLIWWSPWMEVPILPLVYWALPAGWAYWLITPNSRPPGALSFVLTHLMTLTALVMAAIPLCILFWPAEWLPTFLHGPLAASLADPELRKLAWIATPVPVLALVMRYFWKDPAVARRELSNALAAALAITGLLLAIALIDSCGRSLYAVWAVDGIGGWLGAGVGALVAAYALVQRFASVLVPSGEGKWRLPTTMVIALAAVVIHGCLLIVICAVAHGISWAGKPTPFVPTGLTSATVEIPFALKDGTLAVGMPVTKTPPHHVAASAPDCTWTVSGLIAALLLTGAYAWAMSFVNNSSLAGVYSARLTRSYLGASNPDRIEHNKRITDVLPSDDLSSPMLGKTSDYHPEANGGPLHLINVTINETVDGRSRIQQQDRKGLGMAVGPAGLSVGLRHHAQPEDNGWMKPYAGKAIGHRVFTDRFLPEPLSLGKLIGISGAAFSTGIGSRTSMALSLLCGVFNVRTGHWWDHHQKRLCVFGVQGFLLHEWLARFPGTKWRHWYLSDGGHFENLACYELLRRRVPIIVCCDNGEDPDCLLEDVGNLVRKARLDFGAEINFLDHDALGALPGVASAGVIGTLMELRCQAAAEKGERYSTACATIATIRYHGETEPSGKLLLIKPALLGDEPEDVRHYHRAHPNFPHEPTIDQFFDEAQWESYRRLGEHMGGKLTALIDGWLRKSV